MTEPSGNLSGSSDSGHGFGRQTGSLPLGIIILKSTDEIAFRTERRDRLERIGILKAVYPATWGILQVATGPLSDRWGRKGLIVGGMWVQSAGLFLTPQRASSNGGSPAVFFSELERRWFTRA